MVVFSIVMLHPLQYNIHDNQKPPGQPGAPELSLDPELAERAENLLRSLWEEWREQV